MKEPEFIIIRSIVQGISFTGIIWWFIGLGLDNHYLTIPGFLCVITSVLIASFSTHEIEGFEDWLNNERNKH